MSALTRRRFVQGAGLVGLGLLAGCGRWPGQAPPPSKVPTVGYIAAGTLELQNADQLDAFRQGLAALGYVEGQTLVMAYRLLEGSEAELREAVADLVSLPVDVLVTSGTPATLGAKAATSTIPIVFPREGDPVGTGLVASLARPGGNITGLANFSPQLSGKRLELLAQVVPGLRRVAFVWDPSGPASFVPETQAAAQALGIQLQILEARNAADLEVAFEAANAEQADALLLIGVRFLRDRATVVSLAARSRLPAMYPTSGIVREGGLMAYGANVLDSNRRAAYYVDRILKGTKPADLPVEQPTTFDFVINLKTAQTLGLTIPQHVLLQATEVIQ